MKICILSSGRSPFDERLFYKIARSLRKTYSNITIISPYEKTTDNVGGINILGIPPRKSRWNRIAVWRNLYHTAMKENADIYQCEEIDSWFIGWGDLSSSPAASCKWTIPTTPIGHARLPAKLRFGLDSPRQPMRSHPWFAAQLNLSV